MERPRLATVAVCLFLSAVESRGLIISVEQSCMNAAMGDTALLSVRPCGKLRNHKEVEITEWIRTQPYVHNDYTGRLKLVLLNVSLLHQAVSASDSGGYTVTMTPYTGNSATVKIDLCVFCSIQSDTGTCTAVASTLGVIAGLALITVGLLVFKTRRMALKERSESYTVATVTGTLGTLPIYESCMPSVNEKQECKNQGQPDSNYMALQFRNESVYHELKRV
ncbi:uncharacterized protein [Heptranchias perlo]|uniref:uncharacterized protein isoform X2 n=1 Tax=Heptranchias perlo TaxID=212740 RepID=UPI0035595088